MARRGKVEAESGESRVAQKEQGPGASWEGQVSDSSQHKSTLGALKDRVGLCVSSNRKYDPLTNTLYKTSARAV